jgi:hypothetical protein
MTILAIRTAKSKRGNRNVVVVVFVVVGGGIE